MDECDRRIIGRDGYNKSVYNSALLYTDYRRCAIARLELPIQRNRMREYAAPAQFIAVGWLYSSCHYHAVNVAIIVQMSQLKLVSRDPILTYF